MRCREARSRLSDLAKEGHGQTDQELLAHLKECPACARQAQAARELQQAFSALDTEDVSDAITWSEQVRRVEAQTALEPYHKENPMSALKRTFRRSPRLGFGLAAALALVLAVTLIPFKFDRTVGFEVAVAGVNKDLAFDTNRIDDLLQRLGVNGATVDVTGCEETCNLKIASLRSPLDAEKVKVAFEELSESAGIVQITIELKSIDEQVSGSALKHATTTLISTATSDESDRDELREFVAQKLEGVDGNVFFYCDTLIDGQQHVTIMAGSDSCTMSWTGVGGDPEVRVNCDNMTWVSGNGQPGGVTLLTLDGDSDAAETFGLETSDIVNGHLSAETRQALEAKGYTVEENIDNEGNTVVKLTNSVDGKDHVVEMKIQPPEDAAESEAAKDAADDALPEGFSLSQNYPNPFNPTTDIQFSLPTSQHVTLEIYNIQGQRIRTLVDETMGSGSHTVQWNATDDGGASVASGVYLYRLTAGELSQTKKMSFVK